MLRPELQQIENLDPAALFTIVEVSKLCGVSYAGARRWVTTGKMPSTTVGSRIYVTGESIKVMVK